MKTGCWLFVALSLFALSHLASADDLIVGDKVYKDYQVIRTQFDGIVIKHSAGIATLYFWDLPPDLQKKYNYDPTKVQESETANPAPQALPATSVPPRPQSSDGLQDMPLTDVAPGSPSPAVSPDSGFRTWDDPTYGSFSTNYPPGWTRERWERERLERERKWLREEREKRLREEQQQEKQREEQPAKALEGQREKEAKQTGRPSAQPATRQTTVTAQPATHQAPPQPHVSQPPPPPPKQSPPPPPPSQDKKKNGQ
jgi:hypothetical protein